MLAVLLVVVPASVAYAGIRPGGSTCSPGGGQYPPTTCTTVPSSSTTKPPVTGGTTPLEKVTPSAPGLAKTGSDSTPLVWAGVAALAVGGVLVIGARRRAAVRR